MSGANAGTISFNSTGEISLGGTLNASSSTNAGGKIDIQSDYKIIQSHGSEINTSGNTKGGNILVSAPNIMSSGSMSSKGSQQGGFIDIESEGYIRLLSTDINVAGNNPWRVSSYWGRISG